MNEILCIGAGRGGHGVLLRLAERGLRKFAILDADRIETVNLPNLRLPDRFVGWPKAKQLAFDLAAQHGATARWADEFFAPELAGAASPFADMIFEQQIFLALTDSVASQMAAAATAARLEIPLVAARVFAGGGGDVFAQLDVDSDPCLACFTAHLRRTDSPSEPMRGRDLPVGAGDRVDDFVADVVEALLGTSLELRRAVFSPHPRFGVPCSWEVPPNHDAVMPVFFERDLRCPICGDEARRGQRQASGDRRPLRDLLRR